MGRITWLGTKVRAQVLSAAAITVLALGGCGGSEDPATQAGAFGQIAFLSSHEGNDEIYVIRADGTGLTNVTQSPGDDGSRVINEGPNFAWAPDGKRIAYASAGEIYVVDSDGSNRARLTNDGGASEPAWSPDGTRMAFVSQRDGAPKVYLINADGSLQTRLTATDSGSHENFPAWSPDGAKMAFEVSGTNRGIYVMNADGSGLTKVSRTDERYYAPVWSPDGSKIAITCQCIGPDESIYNKIFVLGVDDLQSASIPSGAVEDEHYDSPSWSPDGQRIAFNALLEHRLDVYVANADGSDPTQLTKDGVSGGPAWSSDGASIAVLRIEEEDGERKGALYVLSANGSAERKITSVITSPYFAWSPGTFH